MMLNWHSRAHEGHLGIVGTKQKLRSKVWWPGMEKDAKKTTQNLLWMSVSQPSQPTRAYQEHSIADWTMERLGN